MPAFVFGIQILAVGWRRSTLRKFLFACNRSMVTDLLYFLLFSSSLSGALVVFGSFGVAYWISLVAAKELSFLSHIRLNTGIAPLNALLFFSLYNFLQYWVHRLSHTQWLWSTHRLHHSATVMNPLVGARHHVNEIVLSILVVSAPMSMICISPAYLVVVGLINSFHSLILHTDVDWHWGWFGRWVMQSPAAHRLHHSTNPDHYGKNLAVMVIWDRLFGTYFHGEIPRVEVGVTELEYDKYGPVFDHFADWWRLLRDVAAGVSALTRRVSVAQPGSETSQHADPYAVTRQQPKLSLVWGPRR